MVPMDEQGDIKNVLQGLEKCALMPLVLQGKHLVSRSCDGCTVHLAFVPWPSLSSLLASTTEFLLSLSSLTFEENFPANSALVRLAICSDAPLVTIETR